MRILIVDDDRPSLKMTAFLLKEEGYTVFTADNGQEALRQIDDKTPDLLILDVMMPGMDGWEVTRYLRRSTNLPILILSAKGETSDRVFGLDLGADDYLAKPFEPSELLARVRAVLRRAEAFTFGEPQTQLALEGFRLDPVNSTATRSNTVLRAVVMSESALQSNAVTMPATRPHQQRPRNRS